MQAGTDTQAKQEKKLERKLEHRLKRQQAKLASGVGHVAALKESLVQEAKANGKYLHKLMRGANVANLSSGLKLKSFKESPSP